MENASKIAPFNNLNAGERELSKKEIAAFLNTYFKFMIELNNHEKLSFFETFKVTKNKLCNVDSSSDWQNEVRESSYYTEYDNMLQIVEFFSLIKFFSYIVDSNLYKLGDMGDQMVDDKYFLPDSNKFSVYKTISYIRNAMNHNNKESFQLFRLIQKQNDPKIYVEIYLRVPNFHIMLTIDELKDLLKPVLKSKSLYTYIYYDSKGNILTDDFLKHIDEDIYYEINQVYDFDDSDIVNDIVRDHNGEEFKKKILFTKEQKEGIKRTFEYYKTNDKIIDSIFLSRIIEESIPFGMTKVRGFLDDINNFLPFIYDYDLSYENYKEEYSRLYYNNEKNALESFDKIYYTNNLLSRFVRSLVLFSSYVLDSIISEDEQIMIDGRSVNKNVPRDSLVHGTYSSVYSNDPFTIALFDYKHKRKSKTDNNRIMENYKLEEFDFIGLYESLYKIVEPTEYPLQLDLIISTPKFNGFKYTFRENDTIFYVNASFDSVVPLFLGIKDVDGTLAYMDDKDFDLLKERINNADFTRLKDIFDLEAIEFVKRLPDISRKATKLLYNLINSNSLSIDAYYGMFAEEINTLTAICSKHPFIPQIRENRIDDEYVTSFYY